MKVLRRWNSITNASAIKAIQYLHQRQFKMALPLLLDASQDPVIAEDPYGKNTIEFYIKSACIGASNFEKLGEMLEEDLMEAVGSKADEAMLLKALVNLFRCYVHQNSHEKALFLTEKYETLLKRKNFSTLFKNQMTVMRMTAQIMLNESDVETLNEVERIKESISDEYSLAMLLNNLAVGKLFIDEDSGQNVIKDFHQAIYILEGLKVSSLASNQTQAKTDDDIDSTLEASGQKIALQEQEAHYRNLKSFLENPKKRSDLYLKNPNSYIPLANLIDTYMKSRQTKQFSVLTLFGVDKNAPIKSSAVHHRLFFYAYKLGASTMTTDVQENYLVQALKTADANDSGFRELLLSEYQIFLSSQRRHYESFHVNQIIFDNIRNGNIHCVEKQFIHPGQLAKDYLILPEFQLHSPIN
jgi:hypothetical protein